jgi:hypothetical protein
MSQYHRPRFDGRSSRGWLIGVPRGTVMTSAVLLGACTVQAGFNAPAPRVYVPTPVVSAEVGGPAVGLAITASEPPPPLPVYEQPPCPQEGFLWIPGNWQYGSAGYFWVPGTWVEPPRVGVLWTPGYWGFAGGAYGFHAGYWGEHVGFYGGVNFGFGYGGSGFVGGRWNGGHYAYNAAVNNVNVSSVHNTYNETVINNNVTINRTSYNGGAGGLVAAPTAQERSVEHEAHIAPTSVQTAHLREASRTPALAAKVNGGHPAIAATARAGTFSGAGVVGARGATGREATPRPESGEASKSPEARAPEARAPEARAAHAEPAERSVVRPEHAEAQPEHHVAPAPHPAAPAARPEHEAKPSHPAKPKPTPEHPEGKREPNDEHR